MAVTQGDVAQVAGVARRTVSNVVNDFPHVSDEVRSRVQAAIHQLGYQPNRAAQHLRTGRSGTIGVVLPELDVGYFAEIGRLLVEEAEARGYTVLVTQTLGESAREIEVLDKFVSQQPDGLIFNPISIGTDELRPYLARFPVVLLGEQFDSTLTDHVKVDNVAATREIVEVMLEKGRRRIAFIGTAPPSGLTMAGLRAEGYRDALAARGIDDDPALTVQVDGYHRAQGYAAIGRLLQEGTEFDGVFCANDLLAFGAIRALIDHGLRVPDDVAVAGFDDLDESRYSVPRLTTVSPDKTGIAARAVQMLVARIDGGDPTPSDADTARHSIVTREST